MDADDEIVCRICRCESTPESPLRQPCRCTGSVGLIHASCLESWLSQSNRVACELCAYKYRWRVGLLPDAPKRLPAHLLLRAAIVDVFRVGNACAVGAVILVCWCVVLLVVSTTTRAWLHLPSLTFATVRERLGSPRLLWLDATGALGTLALWGALLGFALSLAAFASRASTVWRVRHALLTATTYMRRHRSDVHDEAQMNAEFFAAGGGGGGGSQSPIFSLPTNRSPRPGGASPAGRTSQPHPHRLVRLEHPRPHAVCDRCEARIAADSPSHVCARCNYDVCQACFDASNAVGPAVPLNEDADVLNPDPAPAPAPAPARVPAPAPEPVPAPDLVPAMISMCFDGLLDFFCARLYITSLRTVFTPVDVPARAQETPLTLFFGLGGYISIIVCTGYGFAARSSAKNRYCSVWLDTVAEAEALHAGGNFDNLRSSLARAVEVHVHRLECLAASSRAWMIVYVALLTHILAPILGLLTGPYFAHIFAAFEPRLPLLLVGAGIFEDGVNAGGASFASSIVASTVYREIACGLGAGAAYYICRSTLFLGQGDADADGRERLAGAQGGWLFGFFQDVDAPGDELEARPRDVAALDSLYADKVAEARLRASWPVVNIPVIAPTAAATDLAAPVPETAPDAETHSHADDEAAAAEEEEEEEEEEGGGEEDEDEVVEEEFAAAGVGFVRHLPDVGGSGVDVGTFAVENNADPPLDAVASANVAGTAEGEGDGEQSWTPVSPSRRSRRGAVASLSLPVATTPLIDSLSDVPRFRAESASRDAIFSDGRPIEEVDDAPTSTRPPTAAWSDSSPPVTFPRASWADTAVGTDVVAPEMGDEAALFPQPLTTDNSILLETSALTAAVTGEDDDDTEESIDSSESGQEQPVDVSFTATVESGAFEAPLRAAGADDDGESMGGGAIPDGDQSASDNASSSSSDDDNANVFLDLGELHQDDMMAAEAGFVHAIAEVQGAARQVRARAAARDFDDAGDEDGEGGDDAAGGGGLGALLPAVLRFLGLHPLRIGYAAMMALVTILGFLAFAGPILAIPMSMSRLAVGVVRSRRWALLFWAMAAEDALSPSPQDAVLQPSDVIFILSGWIIIIWSLAWVIALDGVFRSVTRGYVRVRDWAITRYNAFRARAAARAGRSDPGTPVLRTQLSACERVCLPKRMRAGIVGALPRVYLGSGLFGERGALVLRAVSFATTHTLTLGVGLPLMSGLLVDFVTSRLTRITVAERVGAILHEPLATLLVYWLIGFWAARATREGVLSLYHVARASAIASWATGPLDDRDATRRDVDNLIAEADELFPPRHARRMYRACGPVSILARHAVIVGSVMFFAFRAPSRVADMFADGSEPSTVAFSGAPKTPEILREFLGVVAQGDFARATLTALSFDCIPAKPEAASSIFCGPHETARIRVRANALYLEREGANIADALGLPSADDTTAPWVWGRGLRATPEPTPPQQPSPQTSPPPSPSSSPLPAVSDETRGLLQRASGFLTVIAGMTDSEFVRAIIAYIISVLDGQRAEVPWGVGSLFRNFGIAAENSNGGFTTWVRGVVRNTTASVSLRLGPPAASVVFSRNATPPSRLLRAVQHILSFGSFDSKVSSTPAASTPAKTDATADSSLNELVVGTRVHPAVEATVFNATIFEHTPAFDRLASLVLNAVSYRRRVAGAFNSALSPECASEETAREAATRAVAAFARSLPNLLTVADYIAVCSPVVGRGSNETVRVDFLFRVAPVIKVSASTGGRLSVFRARVTGAVYAQDEGAGGVDASAFRSVRDEQALMHATSKTSGAVTFRAPGAYPPPVWLTPSLLPSWAAHAQLDEASLWWDSGAKAYTRFAPSEPARKSVRVCHVLNVSADAFFAGLLGADGRVLNVTRNADGSDRASLPTTANASDTRGAGVEPGAVAHRTYHSYHVADGLLVDCGPTPAPMTVISALFPPASARSLLVARAPRVSWAGVWRGLRVSYWYAPWQAPLDAAVFVAVWELTGAGAALAVLGVAIYVYAVRKFGLTRSLLAPTETLRAHVLVRPPPVPRDARFDPLELLAPDALAELCGEVGDARGFGTSNTPGFSPSAYTFSVSRHRLATTTPGAFDISDLDPHGWLEADGSPLRRAKNKDPPPRLLSEPVLAASLGEQAMRAAVNRMYPATSSDTLLVAAAALWRAEAKQPLDFERDPEAPGRHSCGRPTCLERPAQLFRCTLCKKAYYCSLLCANAHYRVHAAVCGGDKGPAAGKPSEHATARARAHFSASFAAPRARNVAAAMGWCAHDLHAHLMELENQSRDDGNTRDALRVLRVALAADENAGAVAGGGQRAACTCEYRLASRVPTAFLAALSEGDAHAGDIAALRVFLSIMTPSTADNDGGVGGDGDDAAPALAASSPNENADMDLDDSSSLDSSSSDERPLRGADNNNNARPRRATTPSSRSRRARRIRRALFRPEYFSTEKFWYELESIVSDCAVSARFARARGSRALSDREDARDRARSRVRLALIGAPIRGGPSARALEPSPRGFIAAVLQLWTLGRALLQDIAGGARRPMRTSDLHLVGPADGATVVGFADAAFLAGNPPRHRGFRVPGHFWESFAAALARRVVRAHGYAVHALAVEPLQQLVDSMNGARVSAADADGADDDTARVTVSSDALFDDLLALSALVTAVRAVTEETRRGLRGAAAEAAYDIDLAALASAARGNDTLRDRLRYDMTTLRAVNARGVDVQTLAAHPAVAAAAARSLPRRNPPRSVFESIREPRAALLRHRRLFPRGAATMPHHNMPVVLPVIVVNAPRVLGVQSALDFKGSEDGSLVCSVRLCPPDLARDLARGARRARAPQWATAAGVTAGVNVSTVAASTAVDDYSRGRFQQMHATVASFLLGGFSIASVGAVGTLGAIAALSLGAAAAAGLGLPKEWHHDAFLVAVGLLVETMALVAAICVWFALRARAARVAYAAADRAADATAALEAAWELGRAPRACVQTSLVLSRGGDRPPLVLSDCVFLHRRSAFARACAHMCVAALRAELQDAWTWGDGLADAPWPSSIAGLPVDPPCTAVEAIVGGFADAVFALVAAPLLAGAAFAVARVAISAVIAAVTRAPVLAAASLAARGFAHAAAAWTVGVLILTLLVALSIAGLFGERAATAAELAPARTRAGILHFPVCGAGTLWGALCRSRARPVKAAARAIGRWVEEKRRHFFRSGGRVLRDVQTRK